MAYCLRSITEGEIASAPSLSFDELEAWNDSIEAKIAEVNESYTVEQIHEAYESMVKNCGTGFAWELQDLIVDIKREYREYRAAEEKMMRK